MVQNRLLYRQHKAREQGEQVKKKQDKYVDIQASPVDNRLKRRR